MLLELAIVIAVGALAGFAASFARGFVRGARSIARGSGWLERRRTERLLVHTVDGQTYEGTLLEVGRDGVVLTAAVLVDQGLAVAGDVWVPRAKVLMVQHPPTAG